MMNRKVIGTLEGLPIAKAVNVDGLLFICGQVAIDEKENKVIGDEIKTQTEATLKNLEAVLKSADSDLSKVDSVNIYLQNREDFEGMNEIYKKYFLQNPPVRTTVVAGIIDTRLLIEISAIAHV